MTGKKKFLVLKNTQIDENSLFAHDSKLETDKAKYYYESEVIKRKLSGSYF